MGSCSARLVLALAAAAVVVVGLKIDGDPIVEVPSVVIQVWGHVVATTTEQADIETNKIPQKNKPLTLRKLIPNYDFPVVPVVKGKSPPRPRPVVHLCRRPQRPPGWSWRLWGRPRFNTKEVVIGGKLGGVVEEKTTRTPYVAPGQEGATTKHVKIGAKLGEVLGEEEEVEEEGVDEEITHP